MKKSEFLIELKNSLEGRLSTHEVRVILNHYEDILDAGLTEGKSADVISEEIGSPARIARNILEESLTGDIPRAKQVGNKFESKLSGGVDKIYDKVTAIDDRIDTSSLASMGRRVGAYLIDAVVISIIIGILFPFIGVFFEALNNLPFANFYAINKQSINYYIDSGMFKPSQLFSNFTIFLPFLILMIIFGLFNFLNTFFIWTTNGYTIGKWIMKIRVIKINGAKIKFWDAALRELLIKTILNAFLSGFLNLISLIWGSVTPDHKTAHDLLSSTKVVSLKLIK